MYFPYDNQFLNEEYITNNTIYIKEFKKKDVLMPDMENKKTKKYKFPYFYILTYNTVFPFCKK